MSDKSKKTNEVPKGDELFIYGRPWTNKWEFTHHVVPPQTSSCTFRLDNVERGGQGFTEFGQDPTQISQNPIYIYDRLDEPSTGMLEQNLSLVEEGQYCFTFACGMAAISAAMMAFTKSGDHILCHQTMYGCTFSLLANWVNRYGLSYELMNMTHLEELKKRITDSTRIVYFETPSNPTLEIIDVEGIAKVVAEINKKRSPENKILVMVDNTFASPYMQRPLTQGADFVIHSLTKNICGFGTVMGGAVIGKHPEYFQSLALYRKDFGGVLSPKHAWEIMVHGLPTLPLRARKQSENALHVARWLETQKQFKNVFYPGLESHPQHALAKKQMRTPEGDFLGGILIYFELGGKNPEQAAENAKNFTNYLAANSLRFTLAVSLGQVRTLIVAPGAMTHSPIPEEQKKIMGIMPEGIRLSLGLENPDMVIEEMKQALKVVK